MNHIWSENKYIETLINVLLMLMGINFMHFGQLFLPVVCFLIFIANRFVFKVNKPIVFVILCLFAVSFYYFSYQLGFYSVMGFTLPMAYYIGSNIKEPSFEKVKKIIFLLAFSMGIHLAINFIYNFATRGLERILHSSSHRDVWVQDIVSSTAMAVDLNILMGSLYYCLFYEKKKAIRYFALSLFVFDMIYCLIMGRRTPLLLLLITFTVVFLYDAFIAKRVSNRVRRVFLCLAGTVLLLFVGFIIAYTNNIGNCREFLDQFYIITKLKNGLIDYTRIEPWLKGVQLMPKYFWGGQKISAELGIQVHELWIDIYDYAGIISYLLMIVYSLCYLGVMIKTIKQRDNVTNRNTLFIGLFLCIGIQMFLEPVMTGESIFLIVSVIIGSMIESMLENE